MWYLSAKKIVNSKKKTFLIHILSIKILCMMNEKIPPKNISDFLVVYPDVHRRHQEGAFLRTQKS